MNGEEVKLQWWWSRDEERFFGPHYSRADAIMDAWADDPDQGAYICQARSGKWNTAIIDDDRLAETFDDYNEERSDPDGDAPSADFTPEFWRDLAKRLNNIIREAINRSGNAAWAFEDQTPPEWVDIHKMWAAAESSETPIPQPEAKPSAVAQAPDEPNPDPAGGVLIQHGMNQKPTEGA